MRKPFMSARLFTSLRNHPPIEGPVLPERKALRPKGA
jgi:hypothetical protein